jgi:hypothetical protein
LGGGTRPAHSLPAGNSRRITAPPPRYPPRSQQNSALTRANLKTSASTQATDDLRLTLLLPHPNQPLTKAVRRPTLPPAPDGWTAASGGDPGGGKSGLHGSTVPDNVRRGRPQGKCHRKQTAGPKPQGFRQVRVKGCGKSAPRDRQRKRHGKPHREQDQIGAAVSPQGERNALPRSRPGRSREVSGNGHPR